MSKLLKNYLKENKAQIINGVVAAVIAGIILILLGIFIPSVLNSLVLNGKKFIVNNTWLIPFYPFLLIGTVLIFEKPKHFKLRLFITLIIIELIILRK